MESSDVERMRLKKQQQKARRREKRAAKQRAAEEAVHISEELRRVRMCWPELSKRTLKTFRAVGGFGPMNDLSNGDWEQLGRDIANCSQLETLDLGDVNVGLGNSMDEKLASLFRGWTRSTSIRSINLRCGELSVEGVRSMVPLLHSTSTLQFLTLNDSNIQSEGFNILFRALRNSPICSLECKGCDIDSIEIGNDEFPRNLQQLWIDDNNINADGCRELAKLLQGGDATLETLSLSNNRIDGDGVEILASVLQNNTSLKYLDLVRNRISVEGNVKLLKLVCDISSMEATLQTNCTLHTIYVDEDAEEIQEWIDYANSFTCNSNSNREKLIDMQLHSMRRANLCRLQGIERSNAAFYGDFDPLHLPEILALVGRTHGLAELHVALKSSIVTLFSTVDRVKCLEQEMAYHQARVASLQAQIGAIKRAEGNVEEVGNDPSNKRRRI
mmetsp:Transcript_25472/g.51115  ORF Transcript_25472/g.51115 Transcript_25472/m.51115 type:complete len:444 (+) Transcript_25472:173-1504(+)